MNEKFTFWASFADGAAGMSDAARLEFYDAVIAYALYDVETELENAEACIAFKKIKPRLKMR